MKKREKIILILAITALLYGAFDYFILSSIKDETIPSETENQFSDFLEEINTTLGNLNIIEQKTSNADYLVSMIESEWKNDPFSKIKKFSKNNQNTAIDKEMEGLIYSGFIRFGNKMLAVIDGMEYTTGEHIKDSGYKIIRITPESVLVNNKVNKKIILYLNEG
ncbi:MAG: hypothetical protein HOG03_01775 [Desulfobacula sp.]|jgi:hypothetical protein|uniref:hypothetical protein n=1 Tax=Desulfobacula sp. TaxID=2593537 RepID=UPI001D850ABE|nr:hypothetical protein [Desulfobacula sp.]MBT3484392.1 hypothetical protein [Desulfobacula sp.]MBT3803307.1 hypothetical protein [Desulfobacula sp.]MBT4023727.1 hypothetical protein [Desulfobacula sp.]MBT4197969.1 hypothetical protein [Desulfobacula sp.]